MEEVVLPEVAEVATKAKEREDPTEEEEAVLLEEMLPEMPQEVPPEVVLEEKQQEVLSEAET